MKMKLRRFGLRGKNQQIEASDMDHSQQTCITVSRDEAHKLHICNLFAEWRRQNKTKQNKKALKFKDFTETRASCA
jgi:hypothetical protein